jgi:hypothetical protein
MPWDLHKADLPAEAKDYLSVLSSSGDERQAAAEAGVSEADIRRWSRDDVFIAHRQQALAYFESWKDWKPAEVGVDPELWPPRGRLDMRYDPYRISHEQAYGDPGEPR